MRCRAVKRMTEDRRWLAARFGSFQWTPWAPSAVQRGRPPKARGDAEPIRMGALGREHLLMAPPAGAPAASAPAAVAEPSVPIATEASSTQSSSSSSARALAWLGRGKHEDDGNLGKWCALCCMTKCCMHSFAHCHQDIPSAAALIFPLIIFFSLQPQTVLEPCRHNL